MHPLGRLITERMELPQHRWSLADVVTRMNKAGHYNIGKSRLGQIRSQPVESIKRDVIFALADGLGVTALTVANAVLESMGIETRPVEVTDSAATILTDPSLGDADRRQLLALLREIRTKPASVLTETDHPVRRKRTKLSPRGDRPGF